MKLPTIVRGWEDCQKLFVGQELVTFIHHLTQVIKKIQAYSSSLKTIALVTLLIIGWLTIIIYKWNAVKWMMNLQYLELHTLQKISLLIILIPAVIE